jgi:hypothetical protein
LLRRAMRHAPVARADSGGKGGGIQARVTSLCAIHDLVETTGCVRDGTEMNAEPNARSGLAADSGPVAVSFPKSGRTWVRSVLKKAGAPLLFTHAGAGSQGHELGRAFAGVDPDILARPALLLHRNPIDTAVSFFFQVTKREVAPGTIKHLQRMPRLWLRGRLPPRDPDAFVLHPTNGVEQVCRFNRAWLDALADRADCRVVTYEALRADPAPGFGTILQWLGRPVDGIEAIIEAKSFDAMQAREKARTNGRPALFGRDTSDPSARKARSGKVGGYADLLAPATVDAARGIAARYGFEA